MTERPDMPLLNAPPPNRVYRLAVLGWPTPDNAPFTQTDDWELLSLYDWVINADERPDWLLAKYTKAWFPALKEFNPLDQPWPGFTRVNYVSRNGAAARARVMRSWGVTVHVVPSDPITWPEGTR